MSIWEIHEVGIKKRRLVKEYIIELKSRKIFNYQVKRFL